MRRRISVLLAMAVMMAMMLSSAGMASAVAIANGKGGEKANIKADQGIAMAVINTQKHDGCQISCN